MQGLAGFLLHSASLLLLSTDQWCGGYVDGGLDLPLTAGCFSLFFFCVCSLDMMLRIGLTLDEAFSLSKAVIKPSIINKYHHLQV